MRHWIRMLLCFLLVGTLTVAALISCAEKAPTDDHSKGEGSAATVDLIKGGAPKYAIVRSNNAGSADAATKLALTTKKALLAVTGLEFSLYTDREYEDDNAPIYEILIGKTNRIESIAAMKTLPTENDYMVHACHNKIVIVGGSDKALEAAVKYFLNTIVGWQSEDDFTTASSIVLDSKLVYTGKVNVPTPPKPGEYGEQNKPTVPVSAYVTPSYKLQNGAYVQVYDGFELPGVRTTFQANTLYSDVYNIHTDSVMVYSSADDNFVSWYSSGDYVIDMMIAINRAGKDYINLDASNYDDIQKDASGNYLEHSAGGSWYMVPSKDWIEYAWERILKPMVEKYHPQSIALEEPEMWIRSGYSEAFKEEWKDFYGEAWQAPNSSAAANLKANLLKTYLFERILIELSSRIKEISPSTQVYIATHSTVNYTAWSINAGLNTYLATGAIDGVIGQTWADTHNSAFAYNGANVRDNFTNAFIEYCSYVDSVEGTNFYALADPMADGGSYIEADLQYIYRQSVAAQLMQPEIHRFQVLPWVQRAFANVSADYRTVQSQIYEMLNEIGGEKITMSAGTPGISYLASDSLSWMNAGSGWALSTANGMYGLCAPLVRDGIPVKMKAMEQIYTAEDLDGVTLLIVSFDSSVPLSEEVNVAIAEWVKAGGTMLYVAGHNQYWNIDDYFFWANDKTPLDNLFKHLGLDGITVNTSGVSLSSALTSTKPVLSEAVKNVKLPTSYASYTVSFTGANNPILHSGSTVLGFTEKVGKGSVVVFGIPSAALSGFEGGSTMMRAMTEFALEYTEYSYVSSTLMITERGNYTAAHAFDSGESLTGTYIDLFDSNLSILKNPDVPKDDSLILYNIAHIDRSLPRLGYTSGQVLSLREEADKTVIKMTSAANVNISVRLLAPNGSYPKSIRVVDAAGKSCPVLAYYWDNNFNSCLIKIDGNADNTTLTVEWGNSPVDLGISSRVFTEEAYKTNKNDNEDAAFIEPETTAAANHGVRFCDGALQLVYKFDLTKYNAPLFRFHISQNYLIEISENKKDWILIADYSNGGTRDRIANGSNAEVFTIDPADYGMEDVMYFRLRNTQNTGGFGGAISSFTIRHLVEEPTVGGVVIAPANRLTGVNNTSSIKDTVKRSDSEDEKKYIVSTNYTTGIATYRRTVKTNSAGADAPFIAFSTAAVNEHLRFCDMDRQLIYMFDVSEMLTASFSFHIFQNYILEVSKDGNIWVMIADYSKGGTVPHLTTGGNNISITINPFDYDCDQTGFCYVRLRNSDTSKGWGGSISQFVLNYTKKIK